MIEKFDPKSKITTTQGKDYLEVKWRIVWFRADHPKGSILTEIVNDDLMKATILDNDGKVLATGHGSSKKQGIAKTRPFEGAETAAIGRALAHAGYGTQFTGEDEGEHLADAPVESTKKKMTEPEKQKFMLDKWAALAERANAVNMKLAPMDSKWASEQMKVHYREQEKFVLDAENQAKVGEQ
jgi:hypothetical protein